MRFSSVKLAYFSPTGTTKKILEGIAQGIGIEPIEHVNMTPADTATKAEDHFTDELVVIGAPVHSGRLPADAVERFKRLQGKGTAAVLVVVYGNREYEDALLELTNLSKEMGFIPISGAAFIGEHSFSTEELPIATGRPDKADMEKATEFGMAVKQKTSELRSLDEAVVLSPPGNFPYRDGMPSVPGSPKTLEDLCTTCGTCAEVCPKGAITVNTSVSTDESLCIMCCACVKECPTHARIMDIPFIQKIAQRLNKEFSSRKEPQLFP